MDKMIAKQEQDCQEKDIMLSQKNLALKTYTSKAEVICTEYTYQTHTPVPFLYNLIKFSQLHADMIPDKFPC